MLTSWLLLPLAANLIRAQVEQSVLDHDHLEHLIVEPRVFRVAIIGGGAAGASAAYHLRNFTNHQPSPSTPPINITLFETADRIGGRTTTVNALDDPRYPAELGASIFVEVNHILHQAAHDFNLSTDALGIQEKESDYSLGVWDGQSFILRMAATEGGGNSWWDIAKMVWRYGLAPYRTQQLMKSTVGRFLRFYEEPIFPFASLDEAAARVGLVDFTASTGKEILKQGGISDKFSTEIIQASTRVNYGQNLGGIHGLETMVCMATDGAMAVEGGNWQIFDRMVNTSGADLRLKTTVHGVIKTTSGTYTVNSKSLVADSGLLVDDFQKQEFDTVILAAPYQFSDITFTPPLSQIPDEIPYVKLHVTLFTTPHRLNPSFFNLDSSASENEIPDMVLTTLPEGVDLGARKGKEGVGPAGFWSVNLLRNIHSEDGTTQHLYKVFSPTKLSGTWMSDLLGIKSESQSSGTKDRDTIDQISKKDITWSYEKVWHSYPYELPRQTFESIKLDSTSLPGGGVWYTSGIESFISTMETSALMGKNVAKLIVDQIAGV